MRSLVFFSPSQYLDLHDSLAMPNSLALPTKSPRPLRFNEADSAGAHEAWGANCGPHSIAAACSLTLEEVRAALPNFKGWMSPTMVSETLRNLTRGYALQKGIKTAELCNGINRVQWEGKWLNPGVPPRVAYFHTHYVAHFDGLVLCTCCQNTEWVEVDGWRDYLLNVNPKLPFHITHHWKLG